MSFTEDEAAVLSAEELLTVDEGQLVRYMERNACADGFRFLRLRKVVEAPTR